MSGLNPASIDLAITSKAQIARTLVNLLPTTRFFMRIGSGQAESGDAGTATGIHSITTLQDTTKGGWTLDSWKDWTLIVTSGGVVKGTAMITGNTASPDNTLTFAPSMTAPVNGDTYSIIKAVNPILGNNFQMEWDDVASQVVIHNDFPIYDGALPTPVYYHISPSAGTDYTIALTTLSNVPATAYNHIFLVNGVPGTHLGTIKIVGTADSVKPAVGGGDTETKYIGWIYRGLLDEIVVVNDSAINLIDSLNYSQRNVNYIDYLDVNTDKKITIHATNILRFGAFFGPGISKTIYEVALYILDDSNYSHVVAYASVPQNVLLTAESLRILWKVII